MSKYSQDELKRKLGEKNLWTITGNCDFPVEGTLSEMIETAHGRHKSGHAVGIIEEIKTEIKLDLIQLELLWQYMGLPTI